MYARATSLRLENPARRALGAEAEAFIGADAWEACARSLRDAEAEGWDACALLLDAFAQRDFADAEHPAAILAWRIDNLVDEGRWAAERAAQRETEPGGSRPLQTLGDEQLHRLLETAERHRRAALDELHRADAAVGNQPRAVSAHGLPHPAWPRRRYGHLTRAQLAAAAAETRAQGRQAEREGDHAAELAAAAKHTLLRREQRLRHAMRPRDRMREDWQREPRTSASHTALQPVETTLGELSASLHRQETAHERLRRAQLIADKIRAEQRLREKLPQHPPPAPDNTGPLPDWLAPSAAVRDVDTPAGWRDHLVERRLVLAARLQEMGLILADSPPPWAQALGPVPVPGTGLRERWERTAALAEAWRLRRALADDVPGIGEPPSEPRDARAWAALRQRVDEVGRRARASAAARRRPETPAGGMRIAARTAENLQRRQLETALTEPRDRQAAANASAAFAELALRSALEGQPGVEEWVDHIPAPAADDGLQQEQWKQVVAALATYRMLHQIDADEPLGTPTQDTESPGERAELHAAMELFQRSRIQQRLEEVRERRDAGGEGLAPLAPSPPGTRRPRRRTHHTSNEQQHPHQPEPRPGPRRGPGN